MSAQRFVKATLHLSRRATYADYLAYLAAGDDLEEFLDDFPSVSREHAVSFLEMSVDALLVQLGDANPEEILQGTVEQ